MKNLLRTHRFTNHLITETTSRQEQDQAQYNNTGFYQGRDANRLKWEAYMNRVHFTEYGQKKKPT